MFTIRSDYNSATELFPYFGYLNFRCIPLLSVVYPCLENFEALQFMDMSYFGPAFNGGSNVDTYKTHIPTVPEVTTEIYSPFRPILSLNSDVEKLNNPPKHGIESATSIYR